MKRKKIIVFSGSRSEYSLLEPIINELINSKKFYLTLVLANSHFQKEFGYTFSEVNQRKKLQIISIIPPANKNNFYEKNNIKIISSLNKILKKNQPDFFLIYGDRHETFTAAYTCSFLNIPIVHIEGGDITNGGSKDDIFRHAITKLSHVHFTTNIKSYKNIISLGEEKWRVKNCGLPSIEKIKKLKVTSYQKLKSKYNFNKNKKKFIIFTLHSIANDIKQTIIESRESFKSLKTLSNDFNIIITYPNNDEGNKIILNDIKKIANYKIKDIKIVKSLGKKDFFGFLNLINKKNYFSICVGNSSSGIKEALSFNCPSVNIGNRQNGRLSPNSVFNVLPKSNLITNKIQKISKDKNIRKKLTNIQNPYYKKNTCKSICNYLYDNNYNLSKLLLKIHK